MKPARDTRRRPSAGDQVPGVGSAQSLPIAAAAQRATAKPPSSAHVRTTMRLHIRTRLGLLYCLGATEPGSAIWPAALSAAAQRMGLQLPPARVATECRSAAAPASSCELGGRRPRSPARQPRRRAVSCKPLLGSRLVRRLRERALRLKGAALRETRAHRVLIARARGTPRTAGGSRPWSGCNPEILS
jgi:hypothetical protein